MMVLCHEEATAEKKREHSIKLQSLVWNVELMRRLRSFDLADAKMGTALCPGLAFEGRAWRT